MHLYNHLTNAEMQKLIQLSKRYGLTLNQLISSITEESEHENQDSYSCLNGVEYRIHDKL